MKTLLIFVFFLSVSPLLGQPQTYQSPYVLPEVAGSPHRIPPNHTLPPIPNTPNPYDPTGSREGRLGVAFTHASAASMHFINIIDNQIYGGAWLDAGAAMHDIMPQRIWAEGMRATRMHLGVVKARKVISHHVTKSLKGGLSGDFMIIHYQTQFANKPMATESVTLIQHMPGQWKVISYSVK